MNNAPDVPRDRFLRHDAPRRKPRQSPAREKGRRGRDRRQQPRHLGQPFRHAVSRFLQRQNQRQARHRTSSADEAWLKGEFISTVQQRGAAIIKARGLSSAASAANAVVDSVRSLIEPTPAGDWHSVCVCSDGSYGIEKNLICSFPVRSNGQKIEIVQGVAVNDFSRAKLTRR